MAISNGELIMSNSELNDLLKTVETELKAIKETVEAKEPDLSQWSNWNQYVNEVFDNGAAVLGNQVKKEAAFIDDNVSKAYIENTMNYDYGFEYKPKSNAWSVRVEEYVKEEEKSAGGYSIEAKAAPKPEKVKRVRYPAYKKNDRVNTPNGPGNVWSVDRDGTVCVELDSDPTILHEFEKKELKKIK